MSSLIRLFKSGRTVQRVATYLVLGGLSGLMLTACGGGKTSASGTNTGLTSDESANSAQVYVVAKPASRNEAARFLTQSTFGPVDADIDRLMTIGYTAWINEQMTLPLPAKSYQSYWDQRNSEIMAVNSQKRAGPGEVINSFWRMAIAGNDQLRQRVAFALSEIFVVSSVDGCGGDQSRGIAAYMDMLGQQSFGSYRSLLESVALHPVMGCYLSHLRNQKEDPISGRVPDENFAREIMQLFSIGLYELNADGSLKLNGAGQPIETYGPSDIAGLAKVFTGFSWDCPGWPSDRCFKTGMREGDGAKSPNQYTAPMRPYPNFHSISEKRFLGKVIPIQATADPEGSLRVALDALAAHPNVPPFIAKQMIQRLVTSNPSAAYVGRVSSRFKASGLNIGALVSAILLDPEARDMSMLNSDSFGKVREPVLRVSALMRAFGAKSTTGAFLISYDENTGKAMGQIPTRSPSVFNFFRPGYGAPGSNTVRLGRVAPEMQVMNETTAAGYVNYMRDLLSFGVGAKGYDGTASLYDVQFDFNINRSNSLLSLANEPTALVESINQKLMYGTMPSAMKADIVTAISAIDYRAASNPTVDQIFNTQQRRLWSALLLTVASPEYQVQL